jgi:hypothetical protein
MSDWGNKGGEDDNVPFENSTSVKSNVTPFRKKSKPQAARGETKKRKKANENQIITPRVSFPNDSALIQNLDAIRKNSGIAMNVIRHLLPDSTIGVNRLTTVEREDGSVGFIELRLDIRPHGKTYRIVFLADVTGSDDPSHNGFGLNTRSKALSDYGLYTPTNVRELIDAQTTAHEANAQLAIFWCEGEKARIAVADRLKNSKALEWASQSKLVLVTSATLGGQHGALETNYALRPRAGTPKEYIVEGQNATALNLPRHIHFIVMDNDDAGRQEARTIADRFVKEYKVPLQNIHIVEPPNDADEGWDDADPLPDNVTDDDRLAQFITARSLESSIDVANIDQTWPAGVDRDGTPKCHMQNTRAALEKLNVPIYRDTFRDRTFLDGIQYGNEYRTMLYVNKIYAEFLFTPDDTMMHRAVVSIGTKHLKDPLIEYFDSLVWDGVKRIDKWLTTYLQAENTELTRAIGAIVLIAAVRRVKQPGCKFDTMLVLEGEQGSGKSKTVEILGGEFHSSGEIIHLSEKDQLEKLQGVWIQEVAELVGMKQADVNAVKNFLSRRSDRGRPAYGREVLDIPRRCIFIGTTNDSRYLRDETGNRRFWPVRVGDLNEDELIADRDQLWAEAVVRDAARESIVLEKELWEEAAREQDARKIQDPWHERIADITIDDCDIAANSAYVLMPVRKLYTEILDIPTSQQSPLLSKRVGPIMVEFGWEEPRVCTTQDGKSIRAYRRETKDLVQASTGVARRPKTANDDDVPF